VKTPQYRVRKCVREGEPRATNHSRVNPITVQLKWVTVRHRLEKWGTDMSYHLKKTLNRNMPTVT